MEVLHQPLLRLLAVNLGIGLSAAVLLLGGLLAVDPGGLRDLIIADREPAVALGLLLFGFLVTFGSVAMGTAIMTLGGDENGGGDTRRATSSQTGLRTSIARDDHQIANLRNSDGFRPAPAKPAERPTNVREIRGSRIISNG